MIVTEIYNGQGLGNQLWCYVVTRVIAKDKGYDFGIMSPEKFKCLDFLELDSGRPVTGGIGPEGGPPRTLPEGIQYYYSEKRINHPKNGVDIRIYDENLVNIPDNTKIDGIMQDEQYILHRKDEIRQWLKVKPEYECHDYANDDICIINFRGGEYRRIKNVFLPQKYWDDAIRHMRTINKNFKFIVITDDVRTAKKFFPKFDVFHWSIAKDYVVIKNAHYLILSNSSFACFPAWLNENLKFCIAPKYWSQYNNSDGYWGCSYNMMKKFHYLNREGNINDYETCKKEFQEYRESHKEYFEQVKIKENFLMVSNYYNDLSWVPEYTDNYIIYDRNDAEIYPPKLDRSKVIKSENLGYNIRDYCTYIIDHYENLPEKIIFTKGNVFPRHISREYFDSIVNNNTFTSIQENKKHKTYRPICFIGPDGGFYEINNSWYLNHHPTKYFHNFNDFLKFCFKNPQIPKYIRFAPGANYIVPKKNILGFPKVFYQNLKTFVSNDETAIPGESHIIERALYLLWNSNMEINENMLQPINEEKILSYSSRPSFIKKTVRKFMSLIMKIMVFTSKISGKIKKLIPYPEKKETASLQKISEYRKKIKIYDIFTFFNELELLEIRLNILEKYVDYFVIIEATETFSGNPKKLVFEENKERFKKYENKIIHYITRDAPKDENDLKKRLENKNINALDEEIIKNALTSDNVPKGQTHWLKEFYQKESIKKALVGLNDDDICFVGDVDEIWNPEAMIDFTKDDIFKLKQHVYAYYMNNRSNEKWTGTLVTKYKNIKNNCLNHLRTERKTKYTYIDNGGWHFTNQGGPDRIRLKMESYGHQEFNSEKMKSQIENRIKKNQDFVGRRFKFWHDESDLPEYLLENRKKYGHLFKNEDEIKIGS